MNEEVKSVTTGKDPKRVQWGKELGKKNKGRKKAHEEEPNNNKIIMAAVGIGILSIAVFFYFKESKTKGDIKDDDIKQEPFKKQTHDLTI